MPLTLAHPAAVLPLSRFCPRLLCFPALVAGSVSPDLFYVGQRWFLDVLAHRWLGVFVLDLPAGLGLLVLFYVLRQPLAQRMPAVFRPVLELLCTVPRCTVLAALVSVLLGVGTHLLLDALTHKDGWLVEGLPLLQAPVWSVGSRVFRVYHCLWYGASFAGVMWLYLAFDDWRRGGTARVRAKGPLKWREAALMAALLVPFELIHHIVHAPSINLVAAALTVGAMLWLLWRDLSPRPAGD